MKTCILSLLLGTATLGSAADTSNWPQWRGPKDNGSTPAGSLPTKWTASQILWQADLPGKGCSTPIVWNDRIYVTAPVDGRDAVLAYDLQGKKLWQTAFGSENPGRHRNGSGSNPSPVTDGKTLFVTFKSGRFAALELDGSIKWQMDLEEKYGPVKLYWDFGTSPALTAKNVIIARMHNGESWVAAFDKETGAQRWKTDRTFRTPFEIDNSYTTPLVIEHAGREAILTWGAAQLILHDAADGKVIWTCANFNPGNNNAWPAVATPVIAKGMAVVCFGRADKSQPRLHGVKLGGSGDVTATHRAWMRDDVGAFVPSPAEYKGLVYVLSDRGQIDCIEPTTGKSVWTHALPRSSANYYASPLVADGILYVIREDGAMFVAEIDGGFKMIAENRVEDRVIASIVPVAKRLLIRGESRLYCVAAP